MKIYARKDGMHYHFRKDCIMLSGGQFEELLYEEITVDDIKERKLMPCLCTRSFAIV